MVAVDFKLHMDNLTAGRRNRGKVTQTDISDFAPLGESALLSLLHSDIPVERSCAAIHLQKYKTAFVADVLCRQLAVEKKLYTKISLCKTLAMCAEVSIDPLMGLLGKIGNNHETTLPETGFYKISYPLARDIAARTICLIGNAAVLPLENFINTAKDMKALYQALDAYGHILYTNKINRSSLLLQNLHKKHLNNNFSGEQKN